MSSTEEQESPGVGLRELPTSLLDRLLGFLPLRDAVACALTCSRLEEVIRGAEPFWHHAAQRLFFHPAGSTPDVGETLENSAGCEGTPRAATVRHPPLGLPTWRAYITLLQHQVTDTTSVTLTRNTLPHSGPLRPCILRGDTITRLLGDVHEALSVGLRGVWPFAEHATCSAPSPSPMQSR
jgi:hypothetical protein